MIFATFRLAITGLVCPLAPAQASPPCRDRNLRFVEALLNHAESEIDLAKAKLTIDRMIDSSINVDQSMAQLDSMASDIRRALPFTVASRQRLDALRAYLYQAGGWNFDQPFSYRLNDQLGKRVENKLLPTYLKTRKGNCVSMN